MPGIRTSRKTASKCCSVRIRSASPRLRPSARPRRSRGRRAAVARDPRAPGAHRRPRAHVAPFVFTRAPRRWPPDAALTPRSELREHHRHGRPPADRRLDLEPVTGPNVDCSRALDVRHTHTRRPCLGEDHRARGWLHPDAVVGDPQLDVARRIWRAEISIFPSAAALDAVADRVLDQRLQREDGDDRLRAPRVDVHANVEPVTEPGPLEPQILLDVLELVGERDIGALAAERVAREFGELRRAARVPPRAWCGCSRRSPPARCR